MTEQEIEKLREKLGDGFEVTAGYNCAVITVKDIWKGVEFSECVGNNGYSDSWTIGKIYPLKKVSNSKILLCDNLREYCTVIDFDYRHHPELVCFKPSTESAYVEQLKAKAHELYGEIKKGNVFDQSPFNEDKGKFKVERDQIKFSYDKWSDSLYVNGVTLYRGGKWAKRIEEPISNRVSVEPINCSISTPGYRIDGFDLSFEQQEMSFLFSVEGIVIGIKHTKEMANHLAECLQTYLNKQ